jgi:hypothetical protein
MTGQVFSDAAIRRLVAAYPEQPVLLPHGLAGHPLFELEALAQLGARMREKDVEYNRGDLPVGIDGAAVPSNGLSIAETIRGIERNGSWMVLKFVEQDPTYRDLLHDTLAEVRPAVLEATGEMLKLEGFIFVSSPNAVTPFHFDPEHNILCQIRGSKTFTVFPAGDETVAHGIEHERYHAGGHRNLPWRDNLAPKGVDLRMDPGDAVYVPVKAPHYVRNGPAPSVSFSITWRSEWSYAESAARGMNQLLRKAGLNPREPGRFPQQNHAKSLAFRAISKARRVLSAER